LCAWNEVECYIIWRALSYFLGYEVGTESFNETLSRPLDLSNVEVAYFVLDETLLGLVCSKMILLKLKGIQNAKRMPERRSLFGMCFP
jgi:hypothetical protein